jgi:hypothetical protein
MSTETDDGRDTAPVGVDEAFHVRDQPSANWVLKKIIAEREYRARCAAWFDAETRRSERREQFLLHRFGMELEEWTRQQLAGQYGKRRSVHLPAGVLGFRTTPAKLIVADEPKLLAWCRQHLPGAVKVVQHLLKSEIQNHIESNGEVPDGAEFVGGGDKFYIK